MTVRGLLASLGGRLPLEPARAALGANAAHDAHRSFSSKPPRRVGFESARIVFPPDPP